jgi:ABC-2 type transport system permease protein
VSSRVPLNFYLLELKKMISYRADFWIGFVGNVVTQFGVAFFLWKAIFTARGVDEMEGYTFGGLMLYYLLVPLVERIVFGQEMGFMSGEIYDGGLTRYLLYPVSFFRVKYAATLAQSTLFIAQMLLTLTVFLLVFRNPFSLTWRNFAAALPVFLLSGLLHFCLTACLEMTAFWADNVWSIMVFNRMITHLLGGGLIPLAFFPAKLRAVLEYLPFPRVVSFPIRCLLGQVGQGEWLKGMGLTAAWALVFAGLAALVWRKGLKGYSGVGI